MQMIITLLLLSSDLQIIHIVLKQTVFEVVFVLLFFTLSNSNWTDVMLLTVVYSNLFFYSILLSAILRRKPLNALYRCTE